MKKILITQELPDPAEQNLARHFSVSIHRGGAISKQELIEAVQNYDGILSMVCDPLDSEVLSYATRLKAISNYGIGLNNIDLEKAQNCGIRVYNLPDIITNSTADLAMALLLAFARKIPEAARYVQEGHWKNVGPMLFLGEELHQKKLGIIGFGRTGKAMVKRALGFGLDVLVYHRSPIDPSFAGLVSQVSWDDLLVKSDYISLHVSLNPTTQGLIDAEAFSLMEKQPVLINVSRGAVVNTDALVQALKRGQIRGAALDVTDPEPLPSSHPLCSAPNCLIVRHIGTATTDCRRAMGMQAAQHLIDHFNSANL